MNIVFFCSEVVGYTVGMFNAILEYRNDIVLHVVFVDKKRKSMFDLVPFNDRLFFYPRSEYTIQGLLEILEFNNPSILYIPGWMDLEYIKAAKIYKKNNSKFKVVCGIDDQWRGTVRQYLGVFYFKFFYKDLFDFMWVSGKPQYHFAQRMGYDNYRIISNLYAADTAIFNQKAKINKRIVFVGRFVPLKGILKLFEAYEKLSHEIKSEWPLLLIGDGEQKNEIIAKKSEYVQLKPFLQPEELLEELLKGGVACLPALYEQWSVSIHEMALLGFPLLVSSECGATSEFLINGYNGFSFVANKNGSLDKALKQITSLSEHELSLFGQRSAQLGARISTEHVAASFLSVSFMDK